MKSPYVVFAIAIFLVIGSSTVGAILNVGEVETIPDELKNGEEFLINFSIKNEYQFDYDEGINVSIALDDENLSRYVINDSIEAGGYLFKIVPGGVFDVIGDHRITVKVEFYDNQSDEYISSIFYRSKRVKEESVKTPDTSPVDIPNTGVGDILPLLIIVLIGIALIKPIKYFLNHNTKGDKSEKDAKKKEKLVALLKTRNEIKEAIEISKVQYYKRKLNEEGYKQIATENNRELARIEAKIRVLKKDILE